MELRPTDADVVLDLAVIVPCFNVESTLGAQLDALTSQTWLRPWGIIVVDNASTDGTRAVAEAYRDRGVRVVSATAGQGVAYARNAGVRSSQARSVAFCDGDDVVHAGWVAAMGESLTTSPLVSGALETQTLNPAWLAHTRPMGTGVGPPAFGTIRFASGCNSGMTREVFDLMGGFDESFRGLEDIELSLRAAAEGIVVTYVPDAVVAYRLRDAVKDVWRQGVFYGRGRPELKRRARDLGLTPPGVQESLKSWAWLAAHLPGLRDRSGRYRSLWVLANRVGVLHGNLDVIRARRDTTDHPQGAGLGHDPVRGEP